jgi:hypothetical protein
MSKKRITLGEARNLALQIQRDTDERIAIERAEEARRLEDPRITELEAENVRLRAALVKVEAYMAGEEGPICRLWENCDIGDYDDYQTDWEQTLFDLRDWKNGCVPAASLGGGTEWPEVILYREILAALAPPESEVKNDS